MNFTTDRIKLHNGVYMPLLGYDTEKLIPGTAYTSILHAIQTGMRHIDTSADFGVEKDIAEAISLSGIAREELFITDEIPTPEMNTKAAVHAAEASLKRLGIDYVDLFLISWTGGSEAADPDNEVVRQTWKAIEEIYKTGKAKALGILDFTPWQIEYLLQDVEIAPMVSLNCIYPGSPEKEIQRSCDEHNIQQLSYLPKKDEGLLNASELRIFAEKYHTDPYGIILQYLHQKDCAAVLRITPDQLTDTVFTFSEDEMKYLDSIKDYAV